MTYQLHHGDCLNIMPLIERESVDAVICDPPYGLGFMGKDWDHGVPGMHFWLEALRCAKPGAFLLAFGGTRTFHRLAVSIEDAGWEIRDTVMWVYGQGFPKSHDVSKAIDREAGAEREETGETKYAGFGRHGRSDLEVFLGNAGEQNKHIPVTQPATPAAAEWDGWGTALKPAWEPIIVARKSLQGTVAENVQRYGTGALNIDQCRIMPEDQQRDAYAYRRLSSLYSDAYKQVLNPVTSLDSLRYIVSALRSYSIDGICHLRNEGDRGDTLNIPAEYVTLATALFPNGAWCALTDYKVQDSLADCLPYHHLHDEYIHALTVAAQESPASLADALSHICREQFEHIRNHDYQDTARPSSSDAYLPTFCLSFLLNVLKHYTIYLSPRQSNGRWPSNLVHDGSAEVLAGFPMTSSKWGKQTNSAGKSWFASDNFGGRVDDIERWIGDTGSAARFFYTAKSSKSDRNEGLEIDSQWLDSIELIGYNDSTYTISEVLLWEKQGRNQSMDSNGEASQARDIFEGMTPQQGDSDSPMSSSGNDTTGLSLTAIRYTTSTGTRETIELKTLNSLMHSNTSGSTEDVISRLMGLGLSLVESVVFQNLSKLITTSEKMVLARGVNSALLKTQRLISVKDALLERHAPNIHSTVKPTALMRYLCRLITPPNGVILDPFMGSGSTGKAAMLEGFNFIGIDTEIEYVEIAARRIEHACEKVGIVVDQPMMFETKRETVDKPKQLILL